MSIHIYFGNKALVLTDKESEANKWAAGHYDRLFIDDIKKDEVRHAIQQMQTKETKGMVCFYPHVQSLLDAFKEVMEVIPAAGGFVYTPQKQVLLIFRRGKWDLPKGKLDEGESLEACAVREVEEETGLINITLEKPLMITYHTYYQDNKLILKESHWYLMQCQQQAITPQTEEDIEKGEWVDTDNLATYMENTHPSIIDVLKAGISQLGATKEI